MKQDKIPDENCAQLGYYAANNGTFLLTFRDNLTVPSSGFSLFLFLNREYGIERLSRNVGKKLPLLAGQ